MREGRKGKLANYFAAAMFLQMVCEGFLLLVIVLITGGLKACPLEKWHAENFCI